MMIGTEHVLSDTETHRPAVAEIAMPVPRGARRLVETVRLPGDLELR